MYDYGRYGLTEDELSAGIGLILCSRENEYYNKKEELKKKFNKEILFDNNKSNLDLRNSLINGIIHDELLNMIKKYTQDEKLPNEYVNLAKQPNCIRILIKGFLKQKCKLDLTKELIEEIDELIQLLYLNFNLDIVYDRVGSIQEYIHTKIQEKNGKNSHFNLDQQDMKNLLSTARLHLNIYDIKNKSIDSLIDIIRKTNYFIECEYNEPSEPKYISSYSKFVPIWKAKKMKSLFNFSYLDNSILKKLNILFDININLPKNEFIKLLEKL